MVMDIDILRRNTNENPVYYVQYAHARIAAVLRNTAELGIKSDLESFDPSQLTHDRENELLGALAEYPNVVASAAEFREPHHVISKNLPACITASTPIVESCHLGTNLSRQFILHVLRYVQRLCR
jgi:hypothetical protein